jgi:hypothetical protein
LAILATTSNGPSGESLGMPDGVKEKCPTAPTPHSAPGRNGTTHKRLVIYRAAGQTAVETARGRKTLVIAHVIELEDIRDSKSRAGIPAFRFDSGLNRRILRKMVKSEEIHATFLPVVQIV